MCGRFVSAAPASDLAAYLDVDEVVDERAPSWNVAPTDPVYAVAVRRGARTLGTFRWGLVPSWAKDPGVGARMINARAETLTKKFGPAFERRRCLIPADGFYEWEKLDDGTRQPYYIHRADGAPLTFAGLWEFWRDPRDNGRELRTCTIITTDANDLVRPIHDRMPVVLAPSDWERWLDRDSHDVAALAPLLAPADPRQFELYAVDKAVNSVRNNNATLITPWAGGGSGRS
jgi:putative SOS response-associated peptidase YedK